MRLPTRMVCMATLMQVILTGDMRYLSLLFVRIDISLAR